MTTRHPILIVLVGLLLAWPAPTSRGQTQSATTPSDAAQTKLPPIDWSARAMSGDQVKVPADRPTLLLFVRGDHAPSASAIQQVQQINADRVAQVVLIVSGKLADQQARALAGGAGEGQPIAWPIVVDENYAASGKMNVHVWPTTLVVKPDGQQVAHVAGVPKSYLLEVEAYLAYAADQLDDAGLQEKLTSRQPGSDAPRVRAGPRLQIAQRLLARGQVAMARTEVEEAMKLAPDDPAVQLMMARVLVEAKEPQKAIALLDQMESASGAGWQSRVVRARALIAMERWNDAKEILPEAIRLNPTPGEAYYLLGLVHEHETDWQKAAEAFRKAYESSEE